ncbi:hypothetical protein EMIHUDRAFT_311311 [Emiliania huxleyi CCMP1516]|uniref:Uncharacterized protein n=2 Tax=Emiliania huxleyi TaxID=2903 RepID=A0A0D3IPJ6_EMIH1|nr:hypothetical protein EMIHUDRAFT_311311 [Emiliania huxleyi CCMP1516]EOD13181.1 hypothetical protein EMIHUDRAFT_311311 [Emiliania huxleyi CCMP1516]|eukprot:XP_005765610.1 hypothetical protein EMIHUDRAFT_311311 [Emiliania huxleyi CCMP1516]
MSRQSFGSASESWWAGLSVSSMLRIARAAALQWRALVDRLGQERIRVTRSRIASKCCQPLLDYCTAHCCTAVRNGQ